MMSYFFCFCICSGMVPIGWLAQVSLSRLPVVYLAGFLRGSQASFLLSDVPLPGITIPPPLPDFVEPAKTKITTLPNGMKIASETSLVSHAHHFIILNV
jgi:hypothetical protein